jgi:DNA-directed RNA polymerase specialized sigma24 family protein
VRVTQGLVDSREDAEDCASAAVLQLLERGSDGITSTQAFLVTVAKRRAVDKARSHTRARRRDTRLAGQPPTAVDIAEDGAARAEARWVAQVARERLSPKAYRLLRLLADGHDIGAAAAALDMTQRAAESLLLRARRTVRQSWAKTLSAVGICVLAARRLRFSAPAVTLAASALVVAAGPYGDSADRPAPTAPSVAAPAAQATSLALRLSAQSTHQVSAVSSTTKPLTASARRPAAPNHRSVVDLRPPTGGHMWISEEERPGGSGSPVDTIQRCLADFQLNDKHIGC